ncbi:tudor domain-containing protein 7A [Pempheris klunzingeri]|uniref:tudor domain-containing protein 7A n=1 Tax=Pempheris klunzingeri TaxID=3127111 RepID=UPI003980977E
MSYAESTKKMLRSVLQSSKTGISVSSLQSEYRSLCGESIPLKKLGFSKLEDYLCSIPSVVHMEHRTGELRCFAAVCKETAHIAELVAKQRSSKKCGRSQVVNCRMRFKPSNPYMLNVLPRSSLRQPSAQGASTWSANRSLSHGGYRGFSASGDYRQSDQRLSSVTPVEHRQPVIKQHVMPDRNEKSFANCQKPTEKPPEQVSSPNKPQSCVYDVGLVQTRITRLLEKYYSGLWMSKLSGVYSDMFNQKLHPQVLVDMEKWTHICMVEKASSVSRADCLIYPPLLPKPSTVRGSSTTNPPGASPTNSSTTTTPLFSRLSTPVQPSIPRPPPPVPKPRVFSKKPLAKPTFIFPPQPFAASSDKPLSSVTLRSPAHNPALAPQLPPRGNLPVNASSRCKDNVNLPTPTLNQNTWSLAPTWTCPATTSAPPLASSGQPGPNILPLLKVAFCSTSDCAPCPPSKPSAGVSTEVRQRIKELLSKYTHGLWALALPKLFMDTYKMPFPEHILDNLSLLLDICAVEYPMLHDKKKAILYNSNRGETEGSQDGQKCTSHPLPSGLEVLGPVMPPCLVLPSEQYPSVLITDAKGSNAVTIRYVGENYSNAQEAMEEAMEAAMHSFYSHSSVHHLSDPVVGQLVAVRGEDGDELARAQVVEVMTPNKVKVYYVDHGFSVETSVTNLLELHQDFISLPFQATNVRLAGLEAFSSHPLVQSSLDKLAVGKILLMETLEPCQQNEMPVVVLYDTSEDDDININSACMRALRDTTMNNPLTVNATYQDVCVTNVCADGIFYCQLPCRGNVRLDKLLEETEIIFKTQMTSDSLVSRPYCGKVCLARFKGKWSRVEITNMYGNRVMEILFIDLGVPATVEVTDLREVPPLLCKDFTIIPPQAIKCRLADVTVPEGDWSPDAVQWLKEAIMGSEDCKMKILKLDQDKESWLVHMYLFIGAESQELGKSINHQLAQSELWQKVTTQNNNIIITSNNRSVDTALSALVEKLSLGSAVPNPAVKASARPLHVAEDSSLTDTTNKTWTQPLAMPPPLELPQPGQNMDVFVPAACHPGYFVLQPWQDLHKLVVLMGEMILYYNQTCKTNTVTHIQRGEVYAAKIDKNWHRVQVKGILANGLVSVYELDYGKHELVRSTLLWPLIEEFRQLPFQALSAQLAGVTRHQWSEEASMLFRNHVEGRALVAQVESVKELSEGKGELWERRLTVYLVDTAMEERDLWIHSTMANIGGEQSSAA